MHKKDAKLKMLVKIMLIKFCGWPVIKVGSSIKY